MAIIIVLHCSELFRQQAELVSKPKAPTGPKEKALQRAKSKQVQGISRCYNYEINKTFCKYFLLASWFIATK